MNALEHFLKQYPDLVRLKKAQRQATRKRTIRTWLISDTSLEDWPCHELKQERLKEE